jgi:ribonuclease-3
MNHNFKDVALLERAITHRSFSADHNERLEFLGDSVLNLAVAHLLFEQLRDLPEGDLSRVRANLVKQETLHQLALKLEIPACLKLGEGELKSGGQRRPSILADALEALIGAVFLDAGYDIAEKWVHALFQNVEITPQMQAAAKDPKTVWWPPQALRTVKFSMSLATSPNSVSHNTAAALRVVPVSKPRQLPCLKF